MVFGWVRNGMEENGAAGSARVVRCGSERQGRVRIGMAGGVRKCLEVLCAVRYGRFSSAREDWSGVDRNCAAVQGRQGKAGMEKG